MDKNYLVESASQLSQVFEETAVEFQGKADGLIHKMNTVMLSRPDMETFIGKNNLEMMKDNHANHVHFIASILKRHNPEVLVETILWVFRSYRSHGFQSNYWAAQLNAWILIFQDELTEKSYKEVYPYYHWMLINIPTFVNLSDEKIAEANS